MRIPDLLLSKNYLNNISQSKSRIEKLQVQIANGTKISKPSDSPSGISLIMKLQANLMRQEAFASNINNGLSFLNETVFAMENIQSEVASTMTSITELFNIANNGNLNSYADKIDLSLKAIIDAANSEYDGKYLFGGTDFSSRPFGYTADQSNVMVNSTDVGGIHKIRISENRLQKINMTGLEIFGTTITQSGNFNPEETNHSFSADIFDANGNRYALSLEYQKTADNTYELSYDIRDAENNSVLTTPPPAKEIKFNPQTGRIQSVDGNENFSLRINLPENNIDFNLNLEQLTGKTGPTTSSLSANQEVNIFNTLIQIRDNLRAGILPADEDVRRIEEFNKKLLGKISETGNIINRLSDTEDLNTNQKNGLEELLSKEQSLDIAKAVMELQNQDYLLQLSYKLSAMFLPKSILDYL
jgi:flagellar hook-associated protein 3 FlgL